jgi:hypothetical protein
VKPPLPKGQPPLPKRQLDREAALGRFVLAMLLADGPDTGDRLAGIVREAVRLRLARENVLAEEATDPWVLPLQQRQQQRQPQRRKASEVLS